MIRLILRRTCAVLALIPALACAAPTIEAPATAPVGSEVAIKVAGSSNPRDFVTIVPKSKPEGGYDDYAYVDKPGVFELHAPATAGDYEIRVLGASSPYPTLARRALRLESVTATLDAPAQVAAGAELTVQWKGPNNERDYVAIGDASRKYIVYEYTRNGATLKLRAPDQPGEYEVRYILGVGDAVVGARKLTVGSVSASVSAPAQAAAGSKIAVAWKGPNNDRDFITIVKAGTPERQYGAYEYTSKGASVQLPVPDQPGEYEARYLTGQSYATLATTKVTVGKVTASLQGPSDVVGRATFTVRWQGPNNDHDYINIVPKGAHEGEYGEYAYTRNGNPAKLLAPAKAGDYELRYSTGQSNATLASAPLRITPPQQQPGLVKVTAKEALAADGAVEIILDASGSMLQKLGSQRRIDIAKQTLTKLTSSTVPAGTRFALRVFGREADSCQTDLDIPLAPLNATAASARIAALAAKNNAKTPIGASLAKVADDLRGVTGERLVILVTDGEETCGGDPAASIEALKRSGIGVRINIVGFAVDEPAIAATFRRWTDAGGGLYFDARDAAGLGNALSLAVRRSFEVVDAQGHVLAEGLAGGDPVPVSPGDHTVRLKGSKAAGQKVTIREKETTPVTF